MKWFDACCLSHAGLITVSGLCQAGHFCPNGSSSATQNVCPLSHYCPEGMLSENHTLVLRHVDGYHMFLQFSDCLMFLMSSHLGTEYPIGCSNGTFSNTTGLSDSSQCLPCTEGYYCETYGLTAPTGPCRAGRILGYHSATAPVTSNQLDTWLQFSL